MENITLYFDNATPITSMSKDLQIQRENGRYAVSCTASGFNPAVRITIQIGARNLATTSSPTILNETLSIAANAPRFEATASATDVFFWSSDSEKLLRCAADTHTGVTPSTTVEVGVSLIIISCECLQMYLPLLCVSESDIEVPQMYFKGVCKEST